MAKNKRKDELVAGLFVLLGLAVTLGVVLWLGAAEIFSVAADRAYFYVPETAKPTDLGPGSYVFVGSTRVGRIAETRFDPDTGRTLFVADIQHPDVKIRSDAEATAQVGVLGGAQLVVTSRGSADKPLADAEHPVPLVPSGMFAMMEELGGIILQELDRTDPNSTLGKVHAILDYLETTAADVSAMAKRVGEELNPDRRESLLGKIHSSVDHINAVTAELKRQMGPDVPESLLAKIHGIVDTLQGAARTIRAQLSPAEADSLLAKVHTSIDDINDMTGEVKGRMPAIVKNVEVTTEKMREYVEYDLAELLISLRQTGTNILKLSQDFRELSKTSREIITMNRDNIDEMIDNMAAVSADLKAAAREIRRNPWRLLYRPKEGEVETQDLFDAARSFAVGAEQLDQALAKLKAADPETLGPEEMKRIRVHLEQSFERFNRAEQALWKEMNKRR